MTRRRDLETVRAPRNEGLSPRRRFPLALAATLLVAGGMAGFLLGLPGSTGAASPTVAPVSTVAPATAVAGELHPPARYEWLEQEPVVDGQVAWAVAGAVELNGDIFILVANDNPLTSPIRWSLWRSADGRVWDPLPIEVGDDAIINDLDMHGGSLLLSGWSGDIPTLWRSSPIAAGTPPTWSTVTLPFPPDLGGVVRESSQITSAVNDAGEILVLADVDFRIEDVLLGFPEVAEAQSLLRLPALPEIAVTGSRIWVRFVDEMGIETVHTVDVPPELSVIPEAGRYGVDIGILGAQIAWSSVDGSVFDPVAWLHDSPGPVRPIGFGDIFLSPVIGGSGVAELWASADGATWLPSHWAAPTRCGGWRNLAVGAGDLLLTNASFDVMCVSSDGQYWEVHESPATAITSNGGIWIVGDDGGFLATARNRFEYAMLTSVDGVSWDPVMPVFGEVTGRVFLAGDRLVLTDRPPGNQPLPITVWVRQPDGS